MLSAIPTEPGKLQKENIYTETLRTGIIAELDAVNLHRQMAAMANSMDIRKILLDMAKEEKTHAGEFQASWRLAKNRQKSIAWEKWNWEKN